MYERTITGILQALGPGTQHGVTTFSAIDLELLLVGWLGFDRRGGEVVGAESLRLGMAQPLFLCRRLEEAPSWGEDGRVLWGGSYGLCNGRLKSVGVVEGFAPVGVLVGRDM